MNHVDVATIGYVHRLERRIEKLESGEFCGKPSREGRRALPSVECLSAQIGSIHDFTQHNKSAIERLSHRQGKLEERLDNAVAGIDRDQGLAEKVERTLCERIEKLEERVQDLAENFEDRIDVLEQEWLAQRGAKGCVPPPSLPIPPENLDQWADAVEAVQAEIEKRERARQFTPQAPIFRDSQGRLRVGSKPNPNPSEEA